MSDTLTAELATAARHATRNVPTAGAAESAGQVLEAMRGRTYDSASVVAVLDEESLIGLVPIERVLAAAPGARLADLMDTDPPVVAPSTAQERAAWAAVQRAEPALAVVDDVGRFAGLVPATSLLRVLLEEHDEDMARLGGFLRSASPARTTTVEPVAQRLYHRLPWLLVGLGGALLAAAVVGVFEEQLAEEVLIAFFVPGIVYMADAIGTQTEAVVIRGLSLGIGVRRIAVREVTTGVLLGLLLGAASFVLVGAIWSDWRVGTAVGLALVAAASIATAVAMALPWVISRLGKDPAFGSGPLATVIQDILTVTIYLAIASAVVL
ncbi:magnesium transporter [Georgenia yuyongxinii]|uniref:Magnesium transporter n=1 Tax=Georgenia yuyongxinii TaxID=2589797 RepID=A0A552WN15_9MICO|nr:magnesium transporter [Georgenia yuyongxinii]TRW44094.1 magnesium transporter [Georgenia yuyongxinii]